MQLRAMTPTPVLMQTVLITNKASLLILFEACPLNLPGTGDSEIPE
jgi:hypothetical protein